MVERNLPQPGLETPEIAEKTELTKERVTHLLRGLRTFDEVFETYGQTPESFIENLEIIVPAIESCDVLNSGIFHYEIVGSDKNHKIFDHDFKNGVTAIFGFIQLFLSPKYNQITPLDTKIAAAKTIIDGWILYRHVVEDLLLRNVDSTAIRGEDIYPCRIESIQRSLAVFEQVLRTKENVGEKLRIHIDPNLFSELEMIQTNPGVILNAVMNMVRNACAGYIDASSVEVDITRDGNSLLINIRDSGIGMPPSYLDKQHEKYIFAEGRSHRASSGYGLTHMPERVASLGGELSVKSRERVSLPDGRITQSSHEAFMSTNETRTPNTLHLGKITSYDSNGGTQYVHASTIFQLRIPISQKA